MALPTIIPSIFLLFNSLAFLISSIEETPPDIITGQFDILATFKQEIVAVRQGKHIGISCHPELLDETLIHEICFKGKK